MRYMLASITAAAFLALALACFKSEYKPQATAEASANSNMKTHTEREVENRNTLPLNLPLVEPGIVIAKGKRQLTLYSNDKPVRTYRIGLGFSPVGDKAKQGDGRTPEGEFYICVKNAKSSYYLSLGLSYPSRPHAERGLRSGLITRSQYNEIISALDHKIRPNWYTQLGGEIFIHGNGSSSDWTWGCVALDNSDMKELFDAVPKGTPVLIEP